MGGVLSGMGMKRKKRRVTNDPENSDGAKEEPASNGMDARHFNSEETVEMESQLPAADTKHQSFSGRLVGLVRGNTEKSNASAKNSEANTAPQIPAQGSFKERKSPRSSWDAVLSATVPAISGKMPESRTTSSESLPGSKINAWKNAAQAVKGQRRHNSITMPVGQAPAERSILQDETLHIIPVAQVMGLRKEFEAVSAPKASMNFQQLNKFQARMIRRQGDAVFKALRANNPLVVNKGKHTEKDVREQAKKTAIQVFRSLQYWDYEEEKALPDCTVTFEEYLAAVFHAKMKGPEKPQYDPTSAGLKGILRLQHQAPEKVGPDLLEVPLEDLDDSSLPARQRKLDFTDHPSAEQLEAEWQQRQERENLELDAEEAAAFKNREGAELDGAALDRVDSLGEFEGAGGVEEAGEFVSESEGGEGDGEEGVNAQEGPGADEGVLGEDGVAGGTEGKLARVRLFVLTEAEVQHKLANIEAVRKGVRRTKDLAAKS